MAIRPIVLAATLAVAALGTTTVTAQVYKETVSGHNGPMTVEVTIEKGAVKAVKVLKHSETVGIGSVAVEKIPAAIVKSNKADVAAVTGASVTSKAIEQAVEVALAKATGKSLKAKFKPGTYKSQAYGNNGYLNVEVTVTKDKIKSIKVPANQETPFMGGMAIKSISDDIVRYQTLNVDAASGATVTSAAFKQAVGAALTQSGVNLAALQKPVPQKIKKFKGTRSESYDLVIVGAGGAGLSAAVTAGRAGKYRVIVLECFQYCRSRTAKAPADDRHAERCCC